MSDRVVYPTKFPADRALHRLARLISPGYSACLRCGNPWKFATPHDTPYSATKSCFPLCEPCWLLLGTPEARLPFYALLVLEIWGRPDDWPAIRDAVIREDA